MKKILSFLGSLFGFILGYLLGLFLGNKEKNELQTYIEQKNSCETKFNQEKKDLEEEKKKLNNLSLALDNKNKDLEEKQKDIVNKEKDLKQREENIQTEEQDLTTRRSYITSQEQSLMQRENEITQKEGELNQRETDLNNNSSSNVPSAFFLMDRDLDSLPFELPMGWYPSSHKWGAYLTANGDKSSLFSFLKCALPKGEFESDTDSIIKEEYMRKIYEIFSDCLYFFRSNVYSSEFEYKKNKYTSSFNDDAVIFEFPILFMFSPAVRYRIEFLDNAKTVKCYLKYCLDLPAGQQETAPKFGFCISQIIFNELDKYNDFKNLLKNETYKDEYINDFLIN